MALDLSVADQPSDNNIKQDSISSVKAPKRKQKRRMYNERIRKLKAGHAPDEAWLVQFKEETRIRSIKDEKNGWTVSVLPRVTNRNPMFHDYNAGRIKDENGNVKSIFSPLREHADILDVYLVGYERLRIRHKEEDKDLPQDELPKEFTETYPGYRKQYHPAPSATSSTIQKPQLTHKVLDKSEVPSVMEFDLHSVVDCALFAQFVYQHGNVLVERTESGTMKVKASA